MRTYKVMIHPNNKQEHISRFGYKAIELNNIAGELSAAMIAELTSFFVFVGSAVFRCLFEKLIFSILFYL